MCHLPAKKEGGGGVSAPRLLGRRRVRLGRLVVVFMISGAAGAPLVMAIFSGFAWRYRRASRRRRQDFAGESGEVGWAKRREGLVERSIFFLLYETLDLRLWAKHQGL